METHQHFHLFWQQGNWTQTRDGDLIAWVFSSCSWSWNVAKNPVNWLNRNLLEVDATYKRTTQVHTAAMTTGRPQTTNVDIMMSLQRCWGHVHRESANRRISGCTSSRDSWTSLTHAAIMESSQTVTDDEFLVEHAVNRLQHKAAQNGNCIT